MTDDPKEPKGQSHTPNSVSVLGKYDFQTEEVLLKYKITVLIYSDRLEFERKRLHGYTISNFGPSKNELLFDDIVDVIIIDASRHYHGTIRVHCKPGTTYGDISIRE